MITIEVESAGYHAGDYARITVDGVRILLDRNDDGHCRGLHIVVINPKNGDIELAKVYDTYDSSDDLD